MGKTVKGGQYGVWADGYTDNSSKRFKRYGLYFPLATLVVPRLAALQGLQYNLRHLQETQRFQRYTRNVCRLPLVCEHSERAGGRTIQYTPFLRGLQVLILACICERHVGLGDTYEHKKERVDVAFRRGTRPLRVVD